MSRCRKKRKKKRHRQTERTINLNCLKCEGLPKTITKTEQKQTIYIRSFVLLLCPVLDCYEWCGVFFRSFANTYLATGSDTVTLLFSKQKRQKKALNSYERLCECHRLYCGLRCLQTHGAPAMRIRNNTKFNTSKIILFWFYYRNENKFTKYEQQKQIKSANVLSHARALARSRHSFIRIWI